MGFEKNCDMIGIKKNISGHIKKNMDFNRTLQRR